MKKVLSVVLALVILAALWIVPAAASAQLAEVIINSQKTSSPEETPAALVDFLGTWYGVAMNIGNDSKNLSTLEMEVYLVINEDGSIAMTMDDETDLGSWSYESPDCLVVDTMRFFLRDGDLIVSEDENEMIFSRVKPESALEPTLEPTPEYIPVSTPEATTEPISYKDDSSFVGTWYVHTMVLDGETFDMASMEMSITLNADGTAQINESGDISETTWTVENGTAVVDGMIYAMQEDGTLLSSEYGTEMTLSREMPEISPLNLTGYQAYLGTWDLTYSVEDGQTQEVSGLSIMSLIIAETGKATLNAYGEEEILPWQPKESGISIMGMPAAIQADGKLLIEEDGSQMFFIKVEGKPILTPDSTLAPTTELTAEPTPEATPDPTMELTAEPTPETTPDPTMELTAEPTPENTPDPTMELTAEPTPESTPAPTATPAAVCTMSPERMDVKYVCTSADVNGTNQPASILNVEYAITFLSDGTAEFVLAGVPIPNLPWTLSKTDSQESLSILYIDGSVLNFVVTEAGFTLDWKGTMLLHFEPEMIEGGN